VSAKKKIVINDCYGGFGISPEAALWLFERGMKGITCKVSKYYGKNNPYFQKDISEWRKYLLDKSQGSFGIVVFSPDEQLVINTSPEKRDDPLLIECVETLGKKAFGAFSELKIVKIPANVEWKIEEYDGREWIAEKHRTWA
jgi:hypothetical protein